MTTKYRDPATGKVVLDEVQEPLFDVIDILTGSSVQGIRNYFTDIQAKIGLLSLTNMQQPSMLTKSQSFRVIGIGYDVQNIYAENEACIAGLLNFSNLQFRVDTKDYWVSALNYVAGRQDSKLSIDTTNAATQRRVDVKTGKPAGYINMVGRTAVNIEELTNFVVRVTTSGMSAAENVATTLASPAGTKIRTAVSLQGYRRRPVQ